MLVSECKFFQLITIIWEEKKNPQAEALLWITHRLSSLPLVFSND